MVPSGVSGDSGSSRVFLYFGVPWSWLPWRFVGVGALIFFASPVSLMLRKRLRPLCCGSWPVVVQKRLRQGHECCRERVHERCKPPGRAE